MWLHSDSNFISVKLLSSVLKGVWGTRTDCFRVLLFLCTAGFPCIKKFLHKSACCFEAPLAFFLLLNNEVWCFILVTWLEIRVFQVKISWTPTYKYIIMFSLHREIALRAVTEAQAFHLCSSDLHGDLYIIFCFHTSMDAISFACSSFGCIGRWSSLDG